MAQHLRHSPLWAAAVTLSQQRKQGRGNTVAQPHCNPQLPKQMPFGPRTPDDVLKRKRLHQRVQNVMDRFVCAYKVRGISVAVSVGGDLKTLNHFGTQDENLEVATSPNTVAPIGAISKLFLACLLHKMQEEKRVNLSDEASIQRQIPGTLQAVVARKVAVGQPVPKDAFYQMMENPWFHPGHEIKSVQEYNFLEEEAYVDGAGKVMCSILPGKECHNIHNLLYHRSGMSGYHLFKQLNGQDTPKSLEKTFNDIIKRPLTSFPGLRHLKENFSYELLAYLVEYATGHSYEDEMSNFLLKLGLKSTVINSPTELYSSKSRGSQIAPRDSEINPNDNLVKQCYLNATFVDYRNSIGSSGLCSTVTDLDKMMNIFMARLLRDDDNPNPSPSTELCMPDVREITKMHKNDTFCERDTICGKIISSVGQSINLEYPVQLRSKDGNRSLLIHYQKGDTMESSCIVMACSPVDRASLKCRPCAIEPESSKRRELTLDDYSNGDEMLLSPWEERSCHRYFTISIVCTDRQKNVYEMAKAIADAVLREYHLLD